MFHDKMEVSMSNDKKKVNMFPDKIEVCMSNDKMEINMFRDKTEVSLQAFKKLIPVKIFHELSSRMKSYETRY
jgi:hypothetical protein